MKKITGILLALVLALTLVPTAWADVDGGGDTQPTEVEEKDAGASVTGTVNNEKVTKYFGNLIDAFAYAAEDTLESPTVKLLYSFSIDDWDGAIPEDITVDLNGQTLWVNMTQLAALKEKFSGSGTVEAVDNYDCPKHTELWEYENNSLTEKTVEEITYESDASLRQCTNGHTPVPDWIDESNTIQSYTCAVCGADTVEFIGEIPEYEKKNIEFVEDNIGFWSGANVVNGKEKATVKTVQTDGSEETIFEETMVSINYGGGLFSEVSLTQKEYRDDKTIFTSWETKVDGNAVTKTHTNENGITYQTVTSIKDGTLTIRRQSGKNGQLTSDVTTETYTVTGRNVALTGREYTALLLSGSARWTTVLVVDGDTVTETETNEYTNGTYKSVRKYEYARELLDTDAIETRQPKSQVITEKNSNGDIVRVTYCEYKYENGVQCSSETVTDGKAIVEKRYEEYKVIEGGDEITTTYYNADGIWKAKNKVINIYAENGYECTTIVYDSEDNVTETRVEKCTYNRNDDGKITESASDTKIYTGVEKDENLVEIWYTVEVENEDGSTTSTKTIKDANNVEKGVEKSTWKCEGSEYVLISYKYTAAVSNVNTEEAVNGIITVNAKSSEETGKNDADNKTAKTEGGAIISKENTDKLKTAVEDGTVKTVEVKTDVATLSIDSTAIKTLTQNVEDGQSLELTVANTSAESKEVQNTASDVKAEYKLTATVGGANVFDKSTANTNGEITVSVPYEKSTNGTVAVYYVDEATNAKTKMPSSYADGVLSWTTNHFSTFQVVETVQSSSSGNRHYSAVLASKTANTTTAVKVNSANTFDAGVGIYAASAILSVTGMAWVGKKKF